MNAMASWSFSVSCPDGHLSIQDAFDKATLRRLLRTPQPIRLVCGRCASKWDATERQRAAIEFALANAA